MIDEILDDAAERMGKTIESLHQSLNKIRTGRASPALLEHLSVEYYGTDTPINQVSNISVLDARTLSLAPWEKNMVPVLEKAILEADLGLNPITSGDVIRVPLPPLTEERRIEMAKTVKAEGENSKIAVRNIRRDANNDFKELLKEKEITEDEEKRAQQSIQLHTDDFISRIDTVIAEKEQEIMEV